MRFAKVLVANRGEIACRVIRTLKRLGIASVAIYSEADRDARHVSIADEAVCVGAAPAADSYLNVAAILAAARATGAQAVHPGYGFLSENAEFADACEAAGLRFIGPSGAQMRAFGLKHTARELAREHDVALLPGTGLLADVATALAEADAIGYPVMLKSTAGGGGIGMSLCRDAAQLAAAFESVVRLGSANFAHAGVYLEKFVEHARHIEVQIFGDGRGGVIALGERDCSVQRRHQKVAEETPSPGVSASLRERMLAAAVKAGEAVGYRGAGTVECLVDADAGSFVFLEMNTRLQVEHPVTELVTGIDLVEQQFLVAAGEPPSFDPGAIHPAGHALELRIYAEDPVRFLPGPGTITEWDEPAGDGVRVDAGYQAGNTVTPFYDPLLAKLCVHGADRAQALERARDAVAAFRIAGPKTNLAFHADLLASPDFVSGDYDTSLVSKLRPR